VGFSFATGSFSDANAPKAKTRVLDKGHHSEFSTSLLQGIWVEGTGAERVNEAKPHYPNPKK
jgi:hypothetical protein